MAAGQAVGVVEAVPDKIGNIPGKADQHKQKQHAFDDFFFEWNILVHDVQREEHKYSGAAVNVGPVLQADLRFHSSHMPGDHVDH